jgi:hypothetical protein
VKSVKVDLRGGNDLLNIGNLDLASGAVVGDPVAIAKELKIKTAAGQDTVVLANVSVGSEIEVETGADSDVVLMDKVAAGKSIDVETGAGDDYIGAIAVAAGKEVEIETGNGDNLVAATAVAADLAFTLIGDGTNPGFVTGKPVFEAVFAIFDPILGSQDLATVLGDIAGADAKAIATRELEVETGSGKDAVLVDGAVADKKIEVDLGRGDDSLLFRNNTMRKAELDGGKGTNDLAQSDNIGRVKWKHFQNVI